MANLPSVEGMARALVERSSPEEIDLILKYPKGTGKLADHVARLLERDAELVALRKSRTRKWAALPPSEQSLISDIGTILVGHLLGAGERAAADLFFAESWREFEGPYHRAATEKIDALNTRVAKLKELRVRFGKMAEEIAETVGPDFGALEASRDENLEMIGRYLADHADRAGGLLVSEEELRKSVFEKLGVLPPVKGAPGPKHKWIDHAVLLVFAIRLAVRNKKTISSSIDEVHGPRPGFQVFIDRLEFDLKLRVTARHLLRKAEEIKATASRRL